jgi:hypothetical protein
MPKGLDLEGKRFGYGVVIKRIANYISPKGCPSRRWLLKCDCGNEYTCITGDLTSGNQVACGCAHNLTGKESGNWQGYGDIPLEFFNACKANSRPSGRSRKTKEFSITIEDMQAQWKRQDGKCVYAGTNLTFGVLRRQPNHPKYEERTASLDRIDSSRGYVLGNIEFCHKHVNRMKQSFSKERFIGLCKAIAETNG